MSCENLFLFLSWSCGGLTVFVLEEERRAAALEFSAGHDGDPISQQVGLVHEVCGQQDGAATLLALQQVPGGPAGWGVHSWGGLIQHHHLQGNKQKHMDCVSIRVANANWNQFTFIYFFRFIFAFFMTGQCRHDRKRFNFLYLTYTASIAMLTSINKPGPTWKLINSTQMQMNRKTKHLLNIKCTVKYKVLPDLWVSN